MSTRVVRSPLLVAVPFLMIACAPGTSDPGGGQVLSAVSFGGQTFQVTPGSIVGCQVAFCFQGVDCHACASPDGVCAPNAGCQASGQTAMGASEICSQDGCTPTGCFPAYCTGAGLCTVCDDGDPSTIDQCFDDPASPCRHIPVSLPDAAFVQDLPIVEDVPVTTDVPAAVDLPASPDVPVAEDVPPPPEDVPAPRDVPASPDATTSDPGPSGDPGAGCLDECVKKCQPADDDGDCEKDGPEPDGKGSMPPGWMKSKKSHCDNGKHLGWEKGRHYGWAKVDKGLGKQSADDKDTEGKDDQDKDDDDALTCEQSCAKACAPPDDGGQDPGKGGGSCGNGGGKEQKHGEGGSEPGPGRHW